jgi:hypothetical protein
MPFLGQRQQKFKLVDQKRSFPKLAWALPWTLPWPLPWTLPWTLLWTTCSPATNNTLVTSSLRLRSRRKRAANTGSSGFPIDRFAIGIDRNSVSPHGTALLIFTLIPKHKATGNKSLIEIEI